LGQDLRDQLQASLGTAYTIGRELGGGGMSRVFVAEETTLGRSVVVKVIAPDLAAGVNLDRFKREIRVAARLQHPHIVPVLNAGEADGLPYYTMPYVEGQSLRARVGSSTPIPIAEAISILRDVAKALDYAHARDVVHRDIKPDNVLLAGNAAVVTDFGIAKALSASKTLPSGTTLTQVGTSLGTPAYMAPEQAAADPATDHRADIYAFGVLAYEVLAGRPPFIGRTPQKLLAAQMSERPAPIQELRPDVPPPLAELVMRCLEKTAEDRPQSAAALVQALDSVTTSGNAYTPAPQLLLGGRGALRRALAIYAAAFVIVALLARVATAEIGLPDWLFPAALAVMSIGLPIILFTGYVQRTVQRTFTRTPTLTPGGTPVPPSTMATIALKASPHVTWRRTMAGGLVALGSLVMLTAAYMVLRAFGIGPAGSLLGAGKLRARDRLVVTDFRVSAADTSIAAVASEAVRTDLGESDVVSIVPPGEVASSLRLMQRPPGSRIDVALGRDVATRVGASGLVDGDITPLGGGYVVTLRVVGADSGGVLASFPATADAPRDLLPTLDQLTRRLRGKIGESLKSVHADPPLEQVTTASLPALRKYAEGVRANDIEGNYDRSIQVLREAVALDTMFAMGYRKLGVALFNARLPRESIDSALAKAYQYRDRLTERERDLAMASYFDNGPGRNRAKGIAALQAVLALDPTDPTALNNLAITLAQRRQYAASESLSHRQMAAGRPVGVLAYTNLAVVQFDAGQVADAAATLASARQLFAGNPTLDLAPAYLLLHRNALDSLAALADHVRQSTQPRIASGATALAAHLAMMRGRLHDWARAQAAQRALDAAGGVIPPPLEDSVAAIWADAWFRGQSTRAVTEMDSLLVRKPLRALPVLQRPYFPIAQFYARSGRPDRARTVLAQYSTEVKDSVLALDFTPMVHTTLGEIALAEHRPRDAMAEFRRADTLSDGFPDACTACLPLALARAYDAAGLADSARVSYERYLSMPMVGRLVSVTNGDPSFRGSTYKRLGELYENAGDRQKAVEWYGKFIELWKNADPDLQPVVADVRRRVGKINSRD
jgi:eukaryotic-like serine/threonine-protein kinase